MPELFAFKVKLDSSGCLSLLTFNTPKKKVVLNKFFPVADLSQVYRFCNSMSFPLNLIIKLISDINGRTFYNESHLYFPLESLKETKTAFILDPKKNIIAIIDLASKKKLLKLTSNVKKFFEYQEDGKWFDGMESDENIFFYNATIDHYKIVSEKKLSESTLETFKNLVVYNY